MKKVRKSEMPRQKRNRDGKEEKKERVREGNKLLSLNRRKERQGS